VIKSLIYNQSLALLTDLYQLTMVYGYWKAGIAEREAVFHINFRKWPFKGGFAIAAGLQTAIQFMQEFRFSPSDLSYLEKLNLFDKKFLDFLSNFSFACDISAMPEGSLVFPYEPFFKVKGPIWQAQLLESPMLNIINFQTLIATQSARICSSAYPDEVVEFGLRRAQGIDGSISASRASFIGGAQSTSSVIAGKLFDIPVKGTQAHSWIMAFEKEEMAFETFAKLMPKKCLFLIDTYNTIEGLKKAIKISRSIEGFELYGVRLDSGDLAKLSIEVRKLLDEEHFLNTKIMVSNELDEFLIRDLKQQGAKIDIWGVGTNLVTAKEQPALDGVYKLSAIRNEKGEWVHKLKLSEQTAKVTNPGSLQVRRYFDGKFYVGDAIYDELTGIKDPCTIVNQNDPNIHLKPKCNYKDVLVPIFQKGKLVYESPTLQEMQLLAQQELASLPSPMKRFINPQPYVSGLEESLYKKKIEMIQKLKNENSDYR